MQRPHIWQQEPQPIEDIASVEEFDIVVVGAGVAGVVATHSAAEAGAKVVCCEKFGSWTAHGSDIAGVNSKVAAREGLHVDTKKAARLVFQWGQQQCNFDLITTYAQNSGAMLDRYIDLMEAKGYTVRINDEMTARTDWDSLGEKYYMARSPHLFDIPEGSSLKPERWNLAYLVREVYAEALELGAEFRFNTPGRQLVVQDGRVTGVIVEDAQGAFHKVLARKGVILATGGITDSVEMMECFCPLALRADKNENFPVGGNMGDGLVMGAWAGAAFSRVYPAPVIHPVNLTVLSPGMNSTWLIVNRNGDRFMNEVAWEPLVTNARMNAPGNVAWFIWDANYAQRWKQQEPNKYAAKQDVDLAAEVEACVQNGEYVKADSLEQLAQELGIPAGHLVATVQRYNQACATGDDPDFDVPPRFLSAVEDAPFYACKVNAWLLSVPYGLHVDKHSQVCTNDDDPIPGLFAVGNVQGDFFANSYPVTIPGSNNGRSVTFGRLVGTALAKDQYIDGTPIA